MTDSVWQALARVESSPTLNACTSESSAGELLPHVLIRAELAPVSG
jgi:hypothetical protein